MMTAMISISLTFNDMKHTVLRLIVAIMAIASVSATAMAQPPQSRGLSAGERQKYITEIRNYKHDYLTKALDLSKAQQKDFFTVYDEFEDKVMDLFEQTRQLEYKAIHSTDASDIELESTARTLYSTKLKEGEIELEYYLKFKDILTPKQLISLKNAERKFKQQLMHQQRKAMHHKKNSKKD